MVNCFPTIFSMVAIEINDVKLSNGEAVGEVQLPHMFEGFVRQISRKTINQL